METIVVDENGSLINDSVMNANNVVFGSALEEIKGTKSIETSEKSLEGGVYSVSIDGINFIGPEAKIAIRANSKNKVSLKSDSNILDEIKIKVDEASKTISLEGNRKNLYQPHDFELTISCDIKSVYINGAFGIDFEITGSENFELEIKGANSGTVSTTALKEISVYETGTNHITLRGSAQSLKAKINGTSTLLAGDFKTKTAQIEAFGTSRCEVNAIEFLKATAHGVSSINYTEKPTEIEKHIEGLSSVAAK